MCERRWISRCSGEEPRWPSGPDGRCGRTRCACRWRRPPLAPARTAPKFLPGRRSCIERRVLGAWLDGARLGQGFAGDRRGVHAQRERFDQAAVGRNEIAFLQQHDIARHKIGGEHFHDLAATHRAHLLRQQLAQRDHGLLGPVFLPEGKETIDDDDADDGNTEPGHALAGIEMLGEKGQRGAYPQDDGKKVGEFARKREQQVLATDFLDVVRPELRQPPRCLVRARPAVVVFRLARDCSALSR